MDFLLLRFSAVFVIIGSLLPGSPTHAQSDAVYEIRGPKSHQLANFVRYQLDTVGLTPEHVLTRPFLETIDPIWYSKSGVYFWMKVTLKNNTKENQLVLTIDQWNEAILYQQSPSGWSQIVSGTDVHVDKRPLSFHRLLSFPLAIEPGETKVILVRARIGNPLMQYYARLFSFVTKLELDEFSHAYQKYIGNQLMVMFVIGIMMVLCLYNLFLYLFSKQTNSLLLGLYFLCIVLVISNVHGLTTNYFLRSFQAFEMKLALVLAHVTPVVIAVFLKTFFRFKGREWESLLLLAFIAFITVSLVYSLNKDQSWLFFERRYIEHSIFIVCTISALVKKKTGAGILLIALLATIATSLYADFNSIIFITPFIGPDMPYLLGLLCQSLIFSFAASYKVRELQKGVEELEHTQRRLIEDQNEKLKAQVAEKTQQLQHALDAVRQQKKELEKVNEELHAHSDAIREFNYRLEKTVEERTEALQSAMNDLETFLYHTSHDLRRPLMTILGITNVIRLDSSPEIYAKCHHPINLINQTVNELDRMLKKLIAISMCYREDLEREPLDHRVLVEECVDGIRQQTSLGLEQLTVKLAPGCVVESNPHLLKIILNSVLENAIQFGGPGVHINISSECSDHEFVILKISDNGPGIEEEYREKVFDMFFRANEKSTGNGLGLYLTKVGITRLGGKVKIVSGVNNGTCLEILLPVEIKSEKKHEPLQATHRY